MLSRIILPGENEKNENDVVIGVVRLKYLKIVLIAICYPLLIVILNLLNGLAVNFATLEIFAGTLGFFFSTMLNLSWIFIVVMITWVVYLLIRDSNVQKNIDKLGRFKIGR